VRAGLPKSALPRFVNKTVIEVFPKILKNPFVIFYRDYVNLSSKIAYGYGQGSPLRAQIITARCLNSMAAAIKSENVGDGSPVPKICRICGRGKGAPTGSPQGKHRHTPIAIHNYILCRIKSKFVERRIFLAKWRQLTYNSAIKFNLGGFKYG